MCTYLAGADAVGGSAGAGAVVVAGRDGAVGCRMGVDLDLGAGSGTVKALEAELEAGRFIIEGEAMNLFFSYFP